MSDDPLQSIAEHRGLVATFFYVVVRWIVGWQFGIIKEMRKDIGEIKLVLAKIAERHRIEDRK